MMKTIFSSILILALLSFQNASNPPKAYIFTSQIEENYTTDTTDLAYSYSSWEYSFIGEYQKALWAFDQVCRSYPSLSEKQKAYFSSFKPVNARDFILRRAGKEKIVMINEAHHQPMHRTFTTSLLEGLYHKGYRFLGLEALIHQDTALNKRGYPILHSGFYTQEPQFGNMVRKALTLGFYVFAYEALSHEANGKEREIQQARNIQKVIEAHPEGKFVIHCGFDHIIESAIPVWGKAMAGRVKEYTGIDPFTINQLVLTEHYLTEKENPYFKMADTLKVPSVFVKELGAIFNGPEGANQYDVRVFHPRTTYINGRPDWLLMQGKRSLYMLDKAKISITYPVIVKAYLAEEKKHAVPVDVIEITNFSDQKALVLPNGRYNLQIYNIAGDTIEIKATIE